MSHHDYTNYTRTPRVETPETKVEEKPEVVEEPTPVTEPEVKPVVEETPAEPEPEKTEEPEEPVIETTRVMGRVVNCVRLNVRKEPKPRAEVVCEINCGTNVEIDHDQSTADFYKIFTASGVEGFCVKTYIKEISEK